jgi:hypothetical protein
MGIIGDRDRDRGDARTGSGETLTEWPYAGAGRGGEVGNLTNCCEW